MTDNMRCDVIIHTAALPHLEVVITIIYTTHISRQTDGHRLKAFRYSGARITILTVELYNYSELKLFDARFGDMVGRKNTDLYAYLDFISSNCNYL